MFVFIVGARREGGGGQGGPAVSVPDGGRVCPADLQEAGVLQVGNTRKENQAEKMECGPLPANLFYLNVTQWLVPGWGCLSVCVAVCLCSDTASGVVVSGHLDLPPVSSLTPVSRCGMETHARMPRTRETAVYKVRMLCTVRSLLLDCKTEPPTEWPRQTTLIVIQTSNQ